MKQLDYFYHRGLLLKEEFAPAGANSSFKIDPFGKVDPLRVDPFGEETGSLESCF